MPKPAALCAAFILASCSHFTNAKYEEHFRLTVRPAAIIEIHNTAGVITFEPSDQPSIEIEARKRALSLDAAKMTPIKVRRDGDRLVITSEFGTNFHGRDVAYTIHAPASTKLELHESAGNISVRDWTGSVDAYQTAGNIEIRMDRLNATEHVSGHNTAGNVSVYFPKGTPVKLSAVVAVGQIENNLGLDVVHENLTGARLSGSVGSNGAPVDLEVTTGNAQIHAE